MIRFHHLAIILVALSLLGLGSCIREYGTVIPAQPTNAADHALYEQKCSCCHGLDQVHAAHETMTRSELEALLLRMQAKPGSDLSTEEIEQILKAFDAKRISPLD